MGDPIDDETYARQLQAEEDRFAANARRPEPVINEDDAALARRLQNELNNSNNFRNVDNHHVPRQEFSGGRTRFQNMHAGQEIIVRLHHPHSGGHIGECLRAQYSTTSEVRFELSKDPGKFLCVDEFGKVQFRQVDPNDRTSCYRFELTLNDTVYLKCTGHMEKLNIAGEVGWFLALTGDGHFIGNAHRGPAAQWRLVASGEPPLTSQLCVNTRAPPTAAPSSSSLSSSATATTAGDMRPSSGSLLSSFNPFCCKEPGNKNVEPLLDTSESEDSNGRSQELNPLLFSDTLGTNDTVPSSGSQAQTETILPSPPNQYGSPTPLLSPAAENMENPHSENAIRDLPQFKAFVNTLKPALKDAVNESPEGFVNVVRAFTCVPEFKITIFDALFG